jgi:hypothetical protein
VHQQGVGVRHLRTTNGGLDGPLFFLGDILSARLVHNVIAFTRDLSHHETTGAPYGALFNACSFSKTSTMVLAQAIQ